ncbi:MAG: hypothetical protein FJ271_17865 [Planctomycetes bacterium]|nr:hypothetical protein [Planctomycetota bacterium]
MPAIAPSSKKQLFATAKTAPEQPATAVKKPGARSYAKPGPDAHGWSKDRHGDLLVDLARAKPRALLPPRWLLAEAKDKIAAPKLEPLAVQLERVAEVDLIPQYTRKSTKDIEKLVADIRARNVDKHDGYVRELRQQRLDLVGLPFLMGDDCKLSRDAALRLQDASALVRGMLGAAERPKAGYPSGAYRFWSSGSTAVLKNRTWEQVLPAMLQILGPEFASYRLPLVQRVGAFDGADATRTLVRFAMFDPAPEVREEAIRELRDRPAKEILPHLGAGLRYPWLPVVRNTLEAAILLQLNDFTAELIPALDEPAPDAPFADPHRPGKLFVRELVRINHHRNCLLCHAPSRRELPRSPGAAPRSTEPSEFVLAVVPAPDRPLPSRTSEAYYDIQRGDVLVRADVTYLRQDFSVIQTVRNSGRWTAEQRYDFLVRTRELSSTEAALAGLIPRRSRTAYHDAVLWALHQLTGLNAPPTAAAWRAALAKQASAK